MSSDYDGDAISASEWDEAERQDLENQLEQLRDDDEYNDDANAMIKERGE
jgi:hypothetical protein